MGQSANSLKVSKRLKFRPPKGLKIQHLNGLQKAQNPAFKSLKIKPVIYSTVSYAVKKSFMMLIQVKENLENSQSPVIVCTNQVLR